MKMLKDRLELLDAVVTQQASCVEIGVLHGDFSVEIISRTGADVTLIDPFLHFENDYEDIANADQDEMDARYKKLVERFHGNSRVAINRDTSWHSARNIHRDNFGFVYIDGNHGFPFVFSDLCAWSQKIKPGGWLCGHDYINTPFCGVRQAVDYFCRATGYRLEYGTNEPFGSFAIKIP